MHIYLLIIVTSALIWHQSYSEVYRCGAKIHPPIPLGILTYQINIEGTEDQLACIEKVMEEKRH